MMDLRYLYTYTQMSGLAAAATGALTVAAIVAAFICVNMFANDYKFYGTIACLFLIVCIGLAVTVNTMIEKERYAKVVFLEPVDMHEFTKHYEIKNQEGMIFTIKFIEEDEQ